MSKRQKKDIQTYFMQCRVSFAELCDYFNITQQTAYAVIMEG